MKIAGLAGGVGGAKLAHGFAEVLDPNEFSVIVNTGDDFIHYGLFISPDIDTVCYTLAGLANPEKGWGRANETFTVLSALKCIHAPDWFLLGDKDLALHLERTRLVHLGMSLTDITSKICEELGVFHSVLPMSDDPVSTVVDTLEYGEIHFQEYFVRHHFKPKTKGFRFQGIEHAQPTQKVKQILSGADLVVICPSNPFVSINPILALPEIKNILKNKFVIGVSPIINGKAVKGPLGSMLMDKKLPVHPESIIKQYEGFLNVFFVDQTESKSNFSNTSSSIMILKEKITLPDLDSRKKLAQSIINTYIKYK